jgi:hypothetical protein
MANYNKSFNFKNGVQVDNNHFIVNANGLVGIGSTTPTQVLDVVGNVNISGFLTAPNLYTTLLSSQSASISTVTAGIVTAGIVTANYYYGDGSRLDNIPTSQWISSGNNIYRNQGLVGIATQIPGFTLQVGGNPNNSQSGVGISSVGNIVISGIVTANSFSGFGSNITNINANNISAGTLGNSYLPSGISVSGIITATGGFVGNITGTSTGLFGTPNITVGILTSSNIITGSVVTGNINSGFSTTGISTVYTLLNIPSSSSIGIGTQTTNANIHIYPSTTSSLQLTSGGNYESYVSIGNSFNRIGNNGEIRFGNTSGFYFYSDTGSLDIINYGFGNINQYLQLGSAGIGTGAFNWIYGQVPNTPLMTLTYEGNLGIGITLPTNTLHVVGISTVQGDSYIDGNLYVTNALSAGTLNANITGNIIGNVTGDVIGNVTGNINGSGISTFNQATISTNLGIGTIASTYSIEIGSGYSRVLINSSSIGINTDTIINGVGLDASSASILAQSVGVGTTSPVAFVDFSSAGDGFNYGRYLLPPVLTSTQITGMIGTAAGAMIYNSTTNKHQGYDGTVWNDLY